MNADLILSTFQNYKVDCLLIGGMNFLLRHQPVLTFDIDFWVRDEPANLACLNTALHELGAQWGPTEASWAPVPDDPAWLEKQPVYCLTTAHGAIDIFRSVRGLDSYDICRERSAVFKTQADVIYHSLSDADMLACQLALDEGERRLDRVAYLRRLLSR